MKLYQHAALVDRKVLDKKVMDDYNKTVSELQAQINNRNTHLSWINAKLLNLQFAMDDIQKALKAIGLEATKVEPQVHFTTNIDYNDVERKMHVSLTCKMIGQRKPENVRYERDSVQRAKEARRRKAEAKFTTISGLQGTMNQFTLDKPERVLFEVWI